MFKQIKNRLKLRRENIAWLEEALFALTKISGMLQVSIESSIGNKKALAIYDCKYFPITYDFAHFLYLATCKMRELNIQSFEVIIVSEKSSKSNKEREMEDRIGAMLIPIAQRWEECKRVSYINDRKYIKNLCRRTKMLFPRKYDGIFYSKIDFKSLYMYARMETEFNGIQSTIDDQTKVENWIQKKGIDGKFITLTIRNSSFQPERNTNLMIYLELAKWLKAKSYEIVILPDTEDQDVNVLANGNHIFYQGAFSITQRNAMYELAYTNIVGSNGPSSIMMLNKKTSFIIHGFCNNTWTEERLNARGLYIGDQLWTHKNSLWVWKPDNLDNLKDAFREIEKNNTEKIESDRS